MATAAPVMAKKNHHLWHHFCMVFISVTALTGLSNKKKQRRGESNLIQREDPDAQQAIRTAAVDTGNNKNIEIAKLLCGKKLDILVLTHDDDDHIKGAIHVLENSPEPIQELWVPAYWMMQNMILERLSKSEGLDEDDAEQLDRALGIGRIATSRESDCFSTSAYKRIFKFSETSRKQEDSAEDAPYPRRTNHSVKHLDDDLEGSLRERVELRKGLIEAIEEFQKAGVDAWQMMTNKSPDQGHPRSTEWNNTTQELAKRTSKRIEFIESILRAAHAKKTIIRCFLPITDITRNNATSQASPAWKDSGEANFLTIINAVEVELYDPRISNPKALLMTLLALEGLSQQNRCALVSFVWPTHADSDNGFIVWSDSGGEWMNLPRFSVPWERIGGMTAPHHGSDNQAHKPIWKAMGEAVQSAKIVVSGDLSEVKKKGSSRVSRADAILSVVVHPGVSEYGVVHCLNRSGNRFPRAEVKYRSGTPDICSICYPSLCSLIGESDYPHTELILTPVSKQCSPPCLGCNKHILQALPALHN